MDPNFLQDAMTRRRFVKLGAVGTVAVLGAGPLAACGSGGDGGEAASAGAELVDEVNDGTLTWLSWAGDATEDFLRPFEKEHGVKVRVKEYTSGEQAGVLLAQSPGTYDVVTIAGEFTDRAARSDLLIPLDPAWFKYYDDLFPIFQKEYGQNTWVDDQLYSIIFKFGNLGLMYRTDKLSESDVESYQVMHDPKVKGYLGWQEHWQNAMGEISISLGNKQAFQISDEAFEELKQELKRLAPQTAGFYSLADMFGAFATGEVWLNPGGGDWAALLLQDDGQPVATKLPREGSTMWTVALSIAKESRRKDLARKFIDYVMSPEGQMAQSLLPSYQAIVPSRAAWELINEKEPKWAKRLDIVNLDGPNALTPFEEGRVVPRTLPQEQDFEEWIELWEEFRASV